MIKLSKTSHTYKKEYKLYDVLYNILKNANSSRVWKQNSGCLWVGEGQQAGTGGTNYKGAHKI